MNNFKILISLFTLLSCGNMATETTNAIDENKNKTLDFKVHNSKNLQDNVIEIDEENKEYIFLNFYDGMSKKSYQDSLVSNIKTGKLSKGIKQSIRFSIGSDLFKDVIFSPIFASSAVSNDTILTGIKLLDNSKEADFYMLLKKKYNLIDLPIKVNDDIKYLVKRNRKYKGCYEKHKLVDYSLDEINNFSKLKNYVGKTLNLNQCRKLLNKEFDKSFTEYFNKKRKNKYSMKTPNLIIEKEDKTITISSFFENVTSTVYNSYWDSEIFNSLPQEEKYSIIYEKMMTSQKYCGYGIETYNKYFVEKIVKCYSSTYTYRTKSRIKKIEQAKQLKEIEGIKNDSLKVIREKKFEEKILDVI